jgi:hypothetical protein
MNISSARLLGFMNIPSTRLLGFMNAYQARDCLAHEHTKHMATWLHGRIPSARLLGLMNAYQARDSLASEQVDVLGQGIARARIVGPCHPGSMA